MGYTDGSAVSSMLYRIKNFGTFAEKGDRAPETLR